ncbi:hypothetical protein [Methylibium rhizosphaerae]|uniref:hypothetical protein n=1 Tax=Methylibium rhizosphaerae TaxID=2570323 RepID=UPI001125D3A4|nr:hypothetical protein [Methylibium rhizosphaerae]
MSAVLATIRMMDLHGVRHYSMRPPMQKLLCALALLLASTVALAQDAKIRVSVTHSGEDAVGKRLAFSLREAVRSSSGYQLVGPEESGLEVKLITLDPETSPRSSSVWTVASATIVMTNFLPYEKRNPQTWYPIYMTSVVMTVGANRTDEQAKSILATLDDSLEKFRAAARGK